MPSALPEDQILDQLIVDARKLHRQGKLEQAAQCYQEVLAQQPQNPDALYLLGLVHYRLGQSQDAIRLIQSALSNKPEHALANAGLAQIYQDIGQDHQAVPYFHKASECAPRNQYIYQGLGLSLSRLGEVSAACDAFRRAIQIDPGFAGAYNNLGNLLRLSGDIAEAETCYKRCLEHLPDCAETYNNLGVLYKSRQCPEKAIEQFECALGIRSGYAEAHNNLGAVLNDQGKVELALIEFHNAMDLSPRIVPAVVNAGLALQNLGRHQEARETLDMALHLDADNFTALWARCVTELESVYIDSSSIVSARERYRNRLKSLFEKVSLDWQPGVPEADQVVGSMQPFLLPYQAGNDLELQSLYGDLLQVVASSETLPVKQVKPVGGIRVGIVSAYFYDHSNWKVPIQGWLKGLSKQVDVFCYHTGMREDHCTLEARNMVNGFYSRLSVEEFSQQIFADCIDVLIYPEIGMNPVTTLLATRRLADIQCTSWGHPVTSGLQTIDYFISSDLMEPEGAESYYREKLIRLPGLSFSWYVPHLDESGSAIRSEFGMKDNDVVYLCIQNLSKYLPEYDYLLVDIARRVPNATFVFIQSGDATTEVLRQRLERQFLLVDLDYASYVKFLPRLDRDAYHRLNQVADIFLDTPEWSGCNSTLEALWCNLPVVTIPGRWMRGRHSLAIYQQMNYSALLAEDFEHYVDLAVHLGLDHDWRQTQRSIIAENKSRLVGDETPVEALLQTLITLVGRSRSCAGWKHK